MKDPTDTCACIACKIRRTLSDHYCEGDDTRDLTDDQIADCLETLANISGAFLMGASLGERLKFALDLKEGERRAAITTVADSMMDAIRR